MIDKILSLFGMCKHKWITKETHAVYAVSNPKVILYNEKYLCCEHCGEWKKVKL